MKSLPLLLIASMAWGFPEMVRHGYVNCTACHVSPDGGGMLTAYGRSLSKEMLSQFGSESMALPLAGLVRIPEPVMVGGDLRAVQLVTDTLTATDLRFFIMQLDAEMGVNTDRFAVMGTLGFDCRAFPKAMFRRHWALFRMNDNWNVRVGKFPLAYGIHSPEHHLDIRMNLGLDEGSESYNAEVSYLGESYDLFVTAVAPRIDPSRWQSETGLAVRSSFNFRERYKVGASAYSGQGPKGSRWAAGPFAMLGFTEHLYLLEEIDYAEDGITPARAGLYNYTKLGWEFVQGLHVFGVGEFAGTSHQAIGGGFNYYPAPHFEVTTQLQRTLSTSEWYAWLQMHIYL
ncbi:MAG: hypothetical protein HYR96_03385 [Deltaproteobacteria bacterium]|nr:hypothetical protein [Deltaproteobacteria bacterium]MBI3294275.1 hypothetical protein [Deltaproteobacteria bacterium]